MRFSARSFSLAASAAAAPASAAASPRTRAAVPWRGGNRTVGRKARLRFH
jgi:hypothetical protein